MSSSTGGSSSTAMTRCPRSSFSHRELAETGAASRGASAGAAVSGGRGFSKISAVRAMCAGVVPQQPPTMTAPARTIWAICSAK